MRIGAFALLALSAAFVSSAKAVPKPDSMAMDVHVTSEELQGNAVPMRLVERAPSPQTTKAVSKVNVPKATTKKPLPKKTTKKKVKTTKRKIVRTTRPPPPPPPEIFVNQGPLWSTMPRSWCYEVLYVKTDWDNNMYCEVNSLGDGCNWRPSDHRGMQMDNVQWYPIPSSWIGADWVSLVYYDTHFDSCYPYCGRMKEKKNVNLVTPTTRTEFRLASFLAVLASQKTIKLLPRTMPQTIGFCGLGAMGLPMASNLARQKERFHVRGFDLRDEALVALEAAGGSRASSATEAAREADAIILMVVNSAQAEDVLFGSSNGIGAAEVLKKGASVILMATASPSAVTSLASRCTSLGLDFVDAPVSGGTKGAVSASLTIMCGASDEAFAKVKPILEVLGDKERIFHVGKEAGQGAAVKTINQLLCGVHIAATAEAMIMAEKAGLDREMMLKILGNSAAGSWMLNDRGPRMLLADPPVSSAVDIFLKDLGLVLDAGRSSKLALPLAAVSHQMFLAASGMGIGGKDDSHVIEAYRVLSGLPRT